MVFKRRLRTWVSNLQQNQSSLTQSLHKQTLTAHGENKIRFTDKKVRLEKIANNQKKNRQVLNLVNMAECNRIPANVSYYNPRVVLEGDRFYIVVSVDDEYAPKKKITTTDSIIGIDLNIKAVVTSDNDVYKSVTVNKRYRKALKKEKRAQRKLSRKYLEAKALKKSLKESKNYIKQRKIKTKYTRRLRYLEESYIDYVITSLKNKSAVHHSTHPSAGSDRESSTVSAPVWHATLSLGRPDG